MSKDWVDDFSWGNDDNEYICDSCGWSGDTPNFVETEYFGESAVICPVCSYILEI